MNDSHKIDKLNKEDYYKSFLQLLEQLTTVEANEISYNDFCKRFDEMNSQVFVIRNLSQNKIIATSSVLIEKKFIHKLSSVGHIEDVVVDKEYRNNGLGKLLIDYCIKYAIDIGCYKVILNCSEDNLKFYKKCGFKQKNVEMSYYKN